MLRSIYIKIEWKKGFKGWSYSQDNIILVPKEKEMARYYIENYAKELEEVYKACKSSLQSKNKEDVMITFCVRDKHYKSIKHFAHRRWIKRYDGLVESRKYREYEFGMGYPEDLKLDQKEALTEIKAILKDLEAELKDYCWKMLEEKAV